MQHILPFQEYHCHRDLRLFSIITAGRGTETRLTLYEAVVPRHAIGSSLWNAIAYVRINPARCVLPAQVL
jgi:hypothetical protein